MKKYFYCSAAVLAFVFLTSCNSHRVGCKQLKKPEDKQGYHFNYDPSRRGGLVLYDKNGDLRVLAEVQPDAIVATASDLATKLAGTIKGQEISIENALKITESISELGKRSVAGNILRDALYRLAEMTISKNSLSADQKEIFLKIMETATKIAEAELKDVEGKIEKAKAVQAAEKTRQSELELMKAAR